MLHFGSSDLSLTGQFQLCVANLVYSGAIVAMAMITQQQLEDLNTLAQFMDFAGVAGETADTGTLKGAFLAAIGAGETTVPRGLGLIPKEQFEAVVNTIQLVSGPAEARVTLPPNLMQRGALITVGYLCRVKVGLLETLAPTTHPPALSPVVTAMPPPIINKVCMGMVARQGDGTELELVADEVVSDGHARWEHIYGVGQRPDPDEECTMSQLTCLGHLVKIGQPPSVDFAVWGPHGQRIERKLRLSGQVFAADGTLRNGEIAGPPDINVWAASYDVFATGSIMLNILDLGTLLKYRKLILRYHARYGPQVWLLLYQADTRFRCEHLLRLKHLCSDEHKQALLSGKTTLFDPSKPWNYTWDRGISDSAWWSKEFNEPAMMLLSRTASLSAVVSEDAPVHASRDAGSHVAAPLVGGADSLTRSQPSKRRSNAQSHPIAGGVHKVNRKGFSLCQAFQTGGCGQTVGNNQCPSNRETVHQCSKCLSIAHGSSVCDKTAQQKPKKRRFNNSKGNGKHK